MTLRKFNYTNRARILREHIQLTLTKQGDDASVISGSVDLSEFNLPTHVLIVEAYARGVRERFDCGPAEGKVDIHIELDARFDLDSTMLNLRAVSIAPLTVGKIGAAARQVAPDVLDEQGRVRPLLPFGVSDNLGQRLWALELDDTRPIVRINRQVGNWQSFAVDADFRAYVLTEIAGQIALWLWNNRDQVEDGGIEADWARYFRLLGQDLEAHGADTSADLWVAGVQDAFASKFGWLERWLEGLGRNDDD